jgi:hypothetical protein
LWETIVPGVKEFLGAGGLAFRRAEVGETGDSRTSSGISDRNREGSRELERWARKRECAY